MRVALVVLCTFLRPLCGLWPFSADESNTTCDKARTYPSQPFPVARHRAQEQTTGGLIGPGKGLPILKSAHLDRMMPTPNDSMFGFLPGCCGKFGKEG